MAHAGPRRCGAWWTACAIPWLAAEVRPTTALRSRVSAIIMVVLGVGMSLLTYLALTS